MSKEVWCWYGCRQVWHVMVLWWKYPCYIHRHIAKILAGAQCYPHSMLQSQHCTAKTCKIQCSLIAQSSMYLQRLLQLTSDNLKIQRSTTFWQGNQSPCVKVKSGAAYHSCCVVVKNIQRCIYAIPEASVFPSNKLAEMEVKAKDSEDPSAAFRATLQVKSLCSYWCPNILRNMKWFKGNFNWAYVAPSLL